MECPHREQVLPRNQLTDLRNPLLDVLHPSTAVFYIWNGNVSHYRNREFEDAIDYYTMALHYCPEDEVHKKDRAVYLANRAQGHLQLEEVSRCSCKVVRSCGQLTILFSSDS